MEMFLIRRAVKLTWRNEASWEVWAFGSRNRLHLEGQWGEATEGGWCYL